MRLSPLLALLVALPLVAGCGSDTPPPDAPAVTNPPLTTGPPAQAQTVADAVASDPQMTTLDAALAAAGLRDVLAGEGPFTLFAPNEAAFNALPEGELDRLMADPAALRRLLEYHVLPNRTHAADTDSGLGMGTLAGPELALDFGPQGFTVTDARGNTARVVEPDIDAGNGVIHRIDAVLRPPTP
ncbi:MAG: fasciclin domain-containing protein [Rubricoccaceae bacterium]